MARAARRVIENPRHTIKACPVLYCAWGTLGEREREREREIQRKMEVTSPLSRYFRERGSASYIVREVLSVRERERERERYRERRKWRHHCRAKIGDEFTLSLAKNSHNWRWACTFPCQNFALFVSPFTERSPLWRWNSQWVHTFHCQNFFHPLCSPSFKWHEPRDEWSKTQLQDRWSNPAQSYNRKRGSASYIVREVRSVRERERERYRERKRDRRKWRHHCRAKIGDEFTLSHAVSAHFPLPKNLTFRFSLHTSCLTIVALKFTLSVAKKFALFHSLFRISLEWREPRRVIENPKQMIKLCPVLLFFPSKKWIKLIPKTIGNRKRDCAWGGSGDKPYMRKSTDRKAQIRKAFVQLSGLICALRSVEFLMGGLSPEPPHAQSLFLFPIVFGINLFRVGHSTDMCSLLHENLLGDVISFRMALGVALGCSWPLHRTCNCRWSRLAESWKTCRIDMYRLVRGFHAKLPRQRERLGCHGPVASYKNFTVLNVMFDT